MRAKVISPYIFGAVVFVIGALTAFRKFDVPEKVSEVTDKVTDKIPTKLTGREPNQFQLKDWKKALQATGKALKDKELPTSAAALAYYATLTFFPVVIGIATTYAFFASPENLLKMLGELRAFVPDSIADLLQTQLSPIAESEQKALGIAVIISIAALIWTTSGGLQNLIKTTNIAYDVEESRGLIKMRLLSAFMSLVLLLLGALVFALLILHETALKAMGAPALLADIFPWLRWPLLVVIISIGLAFIYRYAPNRQEPQWQWVSWGAVAATIIWLLGTALFFYYVQHVGNFGKTYGTFAGMIVLMTWFNLSSLIILLGAQVNKTLEDRTIFS